MDTGEVIIADSRKNPEELAIEAQREEKLAEIINAVVSQLSGEERLILRMRFPVSGDEEPKDIDRISRLLGISKKAVYNRVSRVLKKCRDMMVNSGVNFDDLF
jgi:RNA polymerase sigma factor (sigma-70 family)